jgi:hypothetical protein
MVSRLPTQEGQVGCTVCTRWRATCHGDGWSQRTDTSGRSSARQAPSLPLDERGGKRRPRSQEGIGLVDAKEALAQKIMGGLFGVTRFHCILCGGQPLGPKQRNTRNDAFRRDCQHFRVCQAWMMQLDQVSGHERPMPGRQACSRLTLGAKHRHWSGHDGQDHSEAERPACAPNDLSRPA